MKKHLLHTLLAAGVLLCGASVARANEAEPMLLRQAKALACLAADMDEIFHEDLDETMRYRSISRAELSFRETLCQLATITAQFRDTAAEPASLNDLERSFACVEGAFASVRNTMAAVPMRTSIRGMMQQFTQTVNCVKHINFEAYVRYFDTAPRNDHHHHDHGTPVHGPPPGAGGIYLRVPIQQSTPFMFRQPIR